MKKKKKMHMIKNMNVKDKQHKEEHNHEIKA